MKSKKFVLAALALLAAITMVLLPLAGCKNDSVPETPAAKLVSITVTPSARTVYKVGDEVVHKKDGEIGVTAHYDNETTRPVTGTITTDTSTLTQSAGVKPVTVSYKEGGIEVSGQFEIRVLPTILTEGNWTYVEFGEWPQTIKDASVDVYENTSKQMGMFTYYLGSDENYYVKVTAKPYEDPYEDTYTYTYTYSDGNLVEKDREVYFKVEPIVWRVLNKDYASTGNALLLAEKILTGGIKWADSSNDYMQSYIRQWLNGNSGTGETSDYGGDAGFLQTAFTESARKLIADTSVDNSAASTIPSEITDEDLELGWNSGENQYASDTPTKDKIFLLSQQEATNSEYGFGVYKVPYIARVRVTTDYAKATGAYQGNPSEGYGGWWWLRSPDFRNENDARGIYRNGEVFDVITPLNFLNAGVVPALSISLQ